MVWDEEENRDFAKDLLVAHGIVAPVLYEHIEQMPYWRFHRRATGDATGHQFTFLFYSDATTASAVMKELKENVLLEDALQQSIVEKIIFDDPEKPADSEIDDTSDLAWPVEIMRSWPIFIMGVSATWLGLIEDVMSGEDIEGENVINVLGRYRKAQERISTLWKEEGHHAFLHHLNGIFAYEPVLVRF